MNTGTALTPDLLAQRAPSIFAQSAYRGVSDRYNFLSTASVIQQLATVDILPYSARQSRTRIEGKAGYVKHVVRFRAVDAPLIVGDTIPEIVLTNSHDRASAFSLELGLFRLVCSNGLVTSSALFQSYKIRHVFSSMTDVQEAVHSIMGQVPLLEATVQQWASIPLPLDSQHRFAEQAMGLRWEQDKAPFAYDRLLSTRRQDDAVPTLWNIYNRVQENLMRGMPRDRYSKASRTVTGLDTGLTLNRKLWALAETFTN